MLFSIAPIKHSKYLLFIQMKPNFKSKSTIWIQIPQIRFDRKIFTILKLYPKWYLVSFTPSIYLSLPSAPLLFPHTSCTLFIFFVFIVLFIPIFLRNTPYTHPIIGGEYSNQNQQQFNDWHPGIILQNLHTITNFVPNIFPQFFYLFHNK